MTIHLVISDIHRDIVSLRALIQRYENYFDDIWCLGDVAGGHGEHLNDTADLGACYRLLEPYRHDGKLIYILGNWERWIISMRPDWQN